MSTSKQSGGGGGVQPIPPGSRKIVQNLKEIVPCSEAEIYATLKECDMDPNEAINRLLTQDPFREVKSKREKKKEGKETTESRPRGASNASGRGGRTGSDRYITRGSSTPYNSSESTSFHSKSSYKKENGSTPHAISLSSPPGTLGSTRSRAPPGLSDGAPAENKESSWGTVDVVAPGVQKPSGYQSSWGGGPGQMSMADIVKMGRPQHTPLNGSNSHHNVQGHPSAATHNSSRSSQDYASKEPGPGGSSVQIPSTIDEWPSIEKPANLKAISGYNTVFQQHPDAVDLPYDNIDQHSDADEIRDAEGGDSELSGANDMGSNSISSGKMTEDESRDVSPSENNLYRDTGLYQEQGHAFEHHEVEEVDASVSSVTRDLQQLSVDKNERELPSEEYAPCVVIPEHLQVQTDECSHLSFGSFVSGMGVSYSSGAMSSADVRTHLDEVHSEAGHQDARSSEYYVDDSLGNPSDGTLFHRSGTEAGSYNPPSVSQPEDLKPDNVEMTHGTQYPYPPNDRGYAFEDAQHLNPSFSQTSSQLQNLAALPNVMQSYNSIQGTLSAAGVQPNREADLQYSPFPTTQSLPAKYANSVSTIGSSTISMSEALKTAGLSSTQHAQQNISGTNVATGPPLPQHLAVHPYSQPSLPLGPFANIMGYPFLPQSYTYLPSGFQQTYAGNSSYQQSLAAALPQYKNSVSANSLPQSAAIASGYGAFGNASTLPGNFQMNPPNAPSGNSLNYEDVLSSQYKDNSHLVSLQQSDNSAMWFQGPSSRTMSAVPASTYYNYPGQSQQPSGFRQGQQQPSQNYGALGYANLYHSQTGGVSLDQQHNAREGSINSAQGQPKQSQIWQNSY